jgi:hypothetical protein
MSQRILYHGSNQLFEKVDLSKSRDRRDFGRGFYTTTLKEQAEHWARSIRLRLGGDGAYLYTYSFESSDQLRKKVFSGLSVEWLELIKESRIYGGLRHDYDIVIGPVANDDTFRTITLYLEGDYTAKQAIEQLKYHKPNNQLSLHTEAALSRLKFIGRDEVGK